jgi:hypothetical protein
MVGCAPTNHLLFFVSFVPFVSFVFKTAAGVPDMHRSSESTPAIPL